jgi:methylmalonyl-CoA mutase N-terminal domain/subunit
MQNKIAESAYAYQKAIESNEKIIVGVNQFRNDSEIDIPILKINESIRQEQIKKLQALKNNRDQQKVDNCLKAIKNAATNGTNLMPPVIEAVEAHCTLGEISDTLRTIFGEYQS